MSTIEFPGLWGLKFTINKIAFSILGINVYWYGIIIATGFLLAVMLGMKASKRFGIEPDNIIDLVLFAAPISIITSRLYYVIFSWDQYKNDPVGIFKIWEGGLAIYGAVIGALATAYVFARVKKIKVFNLFDLGVPYLVLAQAIGRWGNFVNQEAYGNNTTLPWGMTSESIKENLMSMNKKGMNIDPNIPVHPTFLYESLWNLGVFFTLLWYTKRKKKDGEVFFLYLVLYGAGRFWIEGLRTDSLMLGSLRVSQVLSLLLVIVFIVVFIKSRKSPNPLVVEGDDTVPSEYSSILEKMKDDEKSIESETVLKQEVDAGTGKNGLLETPDEDDAKLHEVEDEAKKK